jgi:hypothetical protein
MTEVSRSACPVTIIARDVKVPQIETVSHANQTTLCLIRLYVFPKVVQLDSSSMNKVLNARNANSLVLNVKRMLKTAHYVLITMLMIQKIFVCSVLIYWDMIFHGVLTLRSLGVESVRKFAEMA